MALLAGCSQFGDSGSIEGEYPFEEISMVVPYSTGGGFDAYARISAPYWEEHLDGTVVVENITGGGGTVGGSQVYKGDPDGHELMIWDTIQPVLPQIGRDVNFDIRDMSHIGSITRDPNCRLPPIPRISMVGTILSTESVNSTSGHLESVHPTTCIRYSSASCRASITLTT